MDAQKLKDLGTKVAQGEAVRMFQENRVAVASAILDWVPDAHMHSAANLGRFLPRIAEMFKIALPSDPVSDTMGEIVQDLAQALKEEADRRAHGVLPVATTPEAHATPAALKIDPEAQYARFLFVTATLEERQVDALLAWQGTLGEEDKERLYYLCSQADDTKLAALLKQPLKVLKAAVARITLSKKQDKPQTYLQFREEIRADGPLTIRVNSFLAAKGITPMRFWKLVEKFYGNRVKDKAEFTLLMNLGNDEIYAFLHLAEMFKDLFGSSSQFRGDLGKAARTAAIIIARSGRGFSDIITVAAGATGRAVASAANFTGRGLVTGVRAVGESAVEFNDKCYQLGEDAKNRAGRPAPWGLGWLYNRIK